MLLTTSRIDEYRLKIQRYIFFVGLALLVVVVAGEQQVLIALKLKDLKLPTTIVVWAAIVAQTCLTAIYIPIALYDFKNFRHMQIVDDTPRNDDIKDPLVAEAMERERAIQTSRNAKQKALAIQVITGVHLATLVFGSVTLVSAIIAMVTYGS